MEAEQYQRHLSRKRVKQAERSCGYCSVVFLPKRSTARFCSDDCRVRSFRQRVWESDCGTVKLFCGDCIDILPTLKQAGIDAVLTDPPYGLGSWSHTGGHSLSQQQVAEVKSWDARPSKRVFSLMRAISKEQIVWGGNHFLDTLGSCRAPLVWDKRNRGMHFADGEFAWTSFKRGTLRIFQRMVQQTEILKEGRLHPTQKPVELMTWCLDFLPNAQTILDPFTGSGTTGVACIRAGRRFIGIEKSFAYFEVARKRLQAELNATRSTTG